MKACIPRGCRHYTGGRGRIWVSAFLRQSNAISLRPCVEPCYTHCCSLDDLGSPTHYRLQIKFTDLGVVHFCSAPQIGGSKRWTFSLSAGRFLAAGERHHADVGKPEKGQSEGQPQQVLDDTPGERENAVKHHCHCPSVLLVRKPSQQPQTRAKMHTMCIRIF